MGDINVFEQIRGRLSVVDVLGSYLNLKSSGRNYKAICPFHNEKSGSLMISPDKDIWHCFGCGAGGNIFTFVEMYDHVDTKTALGLLAKKAGVTLQTQRPKTQEQIVIEKEQTDTLTLGYKYLEWSANLFHQVLLKILEDHHHPVTKYCQERGLTKATILKFQLGYAPKDNFILKLAIAHKLNTDILIQVGVINKLEEKNALKDKFTDRLIVPINDKSGRVVGFTARVLPYDNNPNRPKYLNSSQSQWFNKSELWYGWYEHSMSIRQKKQVIIVEGNMDVIVANQYGLDYALASQGTSFTVEQLQILKRLTNKILLAFDNDTAGIISGQKFYRQATAMGFEIQKLVIDKQFKDLDEMLSSNLAGENTDTPVIKTLPFLEYIFNQKQLDLQSSDTVLQRQSIIDLLYLLKVSDSITQEQYLTKLSEITNISRATLHQELDKQVGENINYLATNKEPIRPNVTNQQIVLMNWQTLIALEKNNSEQYENIFQLIKNLSPELSKYQNVQDYLTQNQNELEMIADNLANEKVDIKSIIQVLMSIIDQNINQLIAEEKLYNIYLELKKDYI
jgi:DNA primase